MKRKSFIKSLIVGLFAPKVVVDAMKEEGLTQGIVYSGQKPIKDFKSITIDEPPAWAKYYQTVTTENLSTNSFVQIEWPHSGRTKEIREKLIAKYKAAGICINIDALENIQI